MEIDTGIHKTLIFGCFKIRQFSDNDFWLLPLMEVNTGILKTLIFGCFKIRQFSNNDFWLLPLMEVDTGIPKTLWLMTDDSQTWYASEA